MKTKIWKGIMFVVGFAALTAVLYSPPAAAQAVMTDRAISDAIDDELSFDQAVDANDVNISVSDGIVTLSGKVENIIEKERAEKIAEMVRGVRSVVNDIEVEPFWGRTDSEIEMDVEEALLYDPVTESWEVEADVDNNLATITGEVDSWQEKKLAGKVVKGVRGVVDVRNKLKVDFDEERTDEEIRTEIEESFRWDVKLDDGLIEVEVRDRKVKLDGVVGSAAEKAEAELKSWVRGVESVDISGLEVKEWARDDDMRRDKYVVKPDEKIEAAIDDALLYDPRVYSVDVKVDVTAAQATLRGKVDNLRAKRAAAEDARNTVGVLTVDNNIKVRPAEKLSDEKIESNIKSALERDPFLERYEIIVDVVNRTVYLSGTVDSYFEKSKADEIAMEARGVESVRNNLSVEQARRPLGYDPYLNDYYIYDYDWYDYEPKKSFKKDSAIKEEIKDEFFWSPYVDGSDIKVKVNNGVAVLEGTVDTLAEYNAATENAYEGGAVWVDNNLKIK